MLELSAKTNLLEENDYRYSLQDVKDPDSCDMESTPPLRSRETVADALAQAQVQLAAARSATDRLTGQLHAMGDPDAHDTFDAADLSQLESLIKPNTKLIYVESPANPTMVLVDIAAVVEIAHKHGIKVFIDNTFATPYNTTPLDLGVDAVIHSLTKYIGGHGDLLGGAVISNDEQFLRECRLGTLMHFGSVMAPFTAFLVCRGLKTLGVRMKQYNESALKIAKWLEANPKIETVRYPFLESNPQYAIAKKQMKGGGGMISFDVAGGLEAGKKFINSLKLCTLAVSLGDTETLVEQAAAMTHTMIPKEIREAAGITDGMIRMSVGLEDPDDIIADLKQALGD